MPAVIYDPKTVQYADGNKGWMGWTTDLNKARVFNTKGAANVAITTARSFNAAERQRLRAMSVFIILDDAA